MRSVVRSRKGTELIKETLEIILFLAAATLLIFAVVKIYKITLGQELEDAKNTINSVEARVEAIEEGESGKFTVRGMDNWFLAGWTNEDPNKPGRCALDSCICICKHDSPASASQPAVRYLDDGVLDFSGGQPVSALRKFRDLCQENGICRSVEGQVRAYQYYNKGNERLEWHFSIPLNRKGSAVPLLELEIYREEGKLWVYNQLYFVGDPKETDSGETGFKDVEDSIGTGGFNPNSGITPG